MQLSQPDPPKQTGFSTVVVLLAVLVVASLAVTGVVLYQRQMLRGANNSATATQPQTTKRPAQASKSDSNTGYLEIKEWGIKIKLADADKITYTIGGTPNGSSGNADAIVSWATLRLSDSVSTSSQCRPLGYEVEQLLAATNGTKIGNYSYGFSGAYTECGDSNVDPLRAQIANTELVTSAISAE